MSSASSASSASRHQYLCQRYHARSDEPRVAGAPWRAGVHMQRVTDGTRTYLYAQVFEARAALVNGQHTLTDASVGYLTRDAVCDDCVAVIETRHALTPVRPLDDAALTKLATTIARNALDAATEMHAPAERVLDALFSVLRASGTTIDLDDVERRARAWVTREQRSWAQ